MMCESRLSRSNGAWTFARRPWLAECSLVAQTFWCLLRQAPTNVRHPPGSTYTCTLLRSGQTVRSSNPLPRALSLHEYCNVRENMAPHCCWGLQGTRHLGDAAVAPCFAANEKGSPSFLQVAGFRSCPSFVYCASSTQSFLFSSRSLSLLSVLCMLPPDEESKTKHLEHAVSAWLPNRYSSASLNSFLPLGRRVTARNRHQ